MDAAASPLERRLGLALDGPSQAAARGAYVLRAGTLAWLGRTLAAEGIPALLVKGAGLALTVYPVPWARAMVDLDLLVPAGSGERAARALTRGGCERVEDLAPRPFTRAALGELVLRRRQGPAEVTIELHEHLDKVVTRPVDYPAIFSRAEPAPGLPGLGVPAPEDHALLVALHLGLSGFDHPVGFADLARLFDRGLDGEVLVARARAFRLATSTYLALATLRALGAEVPDAILRALAPSRARRRLVERFYAIGGYPVALRPFALGLPWLLAQTPLRDDLEGWVAGLARYAAGRAGDRAAALWSGVRS